MLSLWSPPPAALIQGLKGFPPKCMHYSSPPFHGTILPSTQSWSTRVCTWADFRPTQKVASTRMATKRTFPAWRCRKQPSWNNWLWRRARSQSAARSPVALPWNIMVTTVTLLILCVDTAIFTEFLTEFLPSTPKNRTAASYSEKPELLPLPRGSINLFF